MAAKQGLNRILNGAEKRITTSEANRGYFFVTNDKLAKLKLGKKFDVIFMDEKLRDRHIDSYGRISVGRDLLKKHKDFMLLMQIRDGVLIIKKQH